jgi:hypothetical protein
MFDGQFALHEAECYESVILFSRVFAVSGPSAQGGALIETNELSKYSNKRGERKKVEKQILFLIILT